MRARFLSEMKAAPRPVDINSKIEWEYLSIRNQVMAEILAYPEEQIANISRKR